MNYKVIPIPLEIAESVRKNMISPQYKHTAFASIATGYGPCRSCLKVFDEGNDERILFTYNSFEGLSDLPLPSPIFIHKNECEQFSDEGFPQDLINLPLLFEAFGENSELLKRKKVEREEIDSQIAELFDLGAVKYINLRNSEAGCFVARIKQNVKNTK
jgi:Protein of unknown function (DUF1203)